MATLAAYPGMMQRARKREGLRVCRAAWLVGVSVREYREIESGDRQPSLGTYERISELFGWQQTFVGDGSLAARMEASPGLRGGILSEDESAGRAPREPQARKWRYPWLAVAAVFVAVGGVALIAMGETGRGIFYAIFGLVLMGQAWVIGHPDRSRPSAMFVAKFGIPLVVFGFLTTWSIVRAFVTHDGSRRAFLVVGTALSAVLFAIALINARRAMKAARG